LVDRENSTSTSSRQTITGDCTDTECKEGCKGYHRMVADDSIHPFSSLHLPFFTVLISLSSMFSLWLPTRRRIHQQHKQLHDVPALRQDPLPSAITDAGRDHCPREEAGQPRQTRRSDRQILPSEAVLMGSLLERGSKRAA
jgi:hypothetical protein